jgi:hypothetical protein
LIASPLGEDEAADEPGVTWGQVGSDVLDLFVAMDDRLVEPLWAQVGLGLPPATADDEGFLATVAEGSSVGAGLGGLIGAGAGFAVGGPPGAIAGAIQGAAVGTALGADLGVASYLGQDG